VSAASRQHEVVTKEMQEFRHKIKQKFLKSKKLPANTPQKYGQTMRIGFTRRQDMERRPLVLITFSELFGHFESESLPRDPEFILHRLFIKRNVPHFLDELLHRSQVALFLDVTCL
jgi:hypothetical protein